MTAADVQGRTAFFRRIGEPLKVGPRAYGMTERSTALPDRLLRESYVLGRSAPARLSQVDVHHDYRGAAGRAEVPFFDGLRAAVDQLGTGLP